MGRGTIIGLVCVFALAGCSSDETGAPGENPTRNEGRGLSLSPTSAPTTTTTKAPTTAAAVDHGQVYLELVVDVNCAQQRAEAAYNQATGDDGTDQSDWPAIQAQMLPAYGAYSDALIRFYEGLAQIEWPANVQGDIDALITQASSEANDYRRIAEATSIEDLVAFEWTASDENLAGTVRAKLGLESNVGGNEDSACPAPV